MAQRGALIRVTPGRRPIHPGALAGLAIAALIGGALARLVASVGGLGDLVAIAPYLGRVVAFSLAQAALSTVLSVGLGIGLALALTRRSVPGRDLVLALLGTAAVMPAIVVVFAVVAVYGRSGWLAQALTTLGFGGDLRIYGWPGILIAHAFLNVPFVARVYVAALGAAPAEHWRLARMLGFGPADIFRHIDAPILRAELPGLAGLVFLLCFTSFAIVLTLGGGPDKATLEVAIYQALRIDADFGRAAWLALIQVAVCVLILAALYGAFRRPPPAHTIRMAAKRPDAADPLIRSVDRLFLLLGVLLLAPPIASLAAGAAALPRVLDRDFGTALLTSVGIGFAAALTSCALALLLAAAARDARLRLRLPRWAAVPEFLSLGALACPPFVLAAGLFLWLRPIADPTLAGYVLLPLVDALLALPFAYRLVGPTLMLGGERYGRIADLLGLAGFARLRIVEWPLLKRPLAAAFALALALSFGDFGIVALFGGGELRTLPYLLYERLGAYRFDEAAAVSLVLAAVAFGLAYLSSSLSDPSADRPPP